MTGKGPPFASSENPLLTGKGLTLATRRCCDSNVWHQKPLEGHEPDIVLNAIWRLTVHKHPSWFRIDRRNKILRWFRGVDALVTQTWFCSSTLVTSRPLGHGHWQRLPTRPDIPRFASIWFRGNPTNIQHDECYAGLGVLCAYYISMHIVLLFYTYLKI